jgi:hypothetical protein
LVVGEAKTLYAAGSSWIAKSQSSNEACPSLGAELRCGIRASHQREILSNEEIRDRSRLDFAFAAPAFAVDYYVALRLGGGGCKVMVLTPNPKKFKVMGTYASRAQAKKAMAGMTKCQ